MSVSFTKGRGEGGAVDRASRATNLEDSAQPRDFAVFGRPLGDLLATSASTRGERCIHDTERVREMEDIAVWAERALVG
jgi:hypothetical protein